MVFVGNCKKRLFDHRTYVEFIPFALLPFSIKKSGLQSNDNVDCGDCRVFLYLSQACHCQR